MSVSFVVFSWLIWLPARIRPIPVIRGGGGVRAPMSARVWGREPSSFCLFVAIQLQHGQCALPNSLLLFVQARGVFLGACSFIIACFHATANAPFGSSFYARRLLLAISSGKDRVALRAGCAVP